MRAPLAFRLSPATRAALERRAAADGIDPGAEDFADFVGDLVASVLPDALAETFGDIGAQERRTERSTTLERSCVTVPSASALRAVVEPGRQADRQADRRSTASRHPAGRLVRLSEVRVPSFLAVSAVADSLGISVPTVRRLCRSGAIPAVRIGHQLRIPRDFLDTLPSAVDADEGAPDREGVS